jgi:hypothetical protein
MWVHANSVQRSGKVCYCRQAGASVLAIEWPSNRSRRLLQYSVLGRIVFLRSFVHTTLHSGYANPI